jgi:hypothetical protein
MTTENDKRMEIANKAHAIKFGGSETGMIYAVEWNGKSYTATDTRLLVDEVMADIEDEPYIVSEGPEDDGNLAWAENYGGPGLGGWQG